jgi:large subunit ribosomal protein L19
MAQYLTYQDTQLAVGDTVRLHQEIVEGSKKRIQVFEGIVIAIAGAGTGKTLTLRKIGAGHIGVEKIFPVNLPSIKKIEVKRQGSVRRGKLYYLRNKVGKSATKIKEKGFQRQATATA